MNDKTQTNSTCEKCGLTKPVEGFYRVRGRLNNLCKACVIQRSQDYLKNKLKKCHVCLEEKPLNMFPIRRTRPFVRKNKCRSCTEAHAVNRRTKPAEAPTSRKNRILMKKRVFLLYFQTHPCVDCGEKDPVVLDFDHRVPGEKSFTISQGLGHSYSLHRLMEEIEKCDVRCANCHRRKTAKTDQWNWVQLLESDIKDCQGNPPVARKQNKGKGIPSDKEQTP